MSKTRIFSLLLFTIIVAAIITNPSKEIIQENINNKTKTLLTNQLQYKNKEAIELGMTLFGNQLLREFVSKYVIIENYYLFTIVKIDWQGQETPIGVAAFKKIYLSEKINKKTDEIIRVIKNL